MALMQDGIATIPAGQTISDWVTLDGAEVRFLIIPTGWQTADLNYEVAISKANTAFQVYDTANVRSWVAAAVVANRIYRVPLDTIGGFSKIRLISSIAQSAERRIGVRFRVFD